MWVSLYNRSITGGRQDAVLLTSRHCSLSAPETVFRQRLNARVVQETRADDSVQDADK